MTPFQDAFREALRLLATGDEKLYEIVALSLQVSLSAVLIAALIGLPLAALIAIARFPGRGAVIAVMNALLGLPPVVVGLVVYLTLSRAGPLGDLGLLFTPTAMVVAQSLLVTPIVAAIAHRTLEDFHAEYAEEFACFRMTRLEIAWTLLVEARLSLATALAAGFGRAEACAAERALHEALLDNPRKAVGDADLAKLADPDARENYEVFLPFRDLLADSASLEAAYRRLVTDPPGPIPQLFLDHLVHAILRGVLDGVDNPLQARAGELFFRTQRVTIQDGQIMLGDAETVERLATTGGFGDLGRLLKESNAPMRDVDMDVLGEETAGVYWDRSDRFDTVLDLTFARPGLDAFCRVMEKWIAHFFQLESRIHPVQSIRDERWVWHTGLDADSTALLNALYRGEEASEEALGRLLSLFRLEIKDEAAVIERDRPAARGRRNRMNEDAFNMSVRKFLKKVGVTSQREIEQAVRAAIEARTIDASKPLTAQVRLTVAGVGLYVEIDGALELE
eukprot:g11731.t1